jgi:protein associated with RNAse G/E
MEAQLIAFPLVLSFSFSQENGNSIASLENKSTAAYANRHSPALLKEKRTKHIKYGLRYA